MTETREAYEIVKADGAYPWKTIIRRLLSCAQTGGAAIISVSVVVDADGNPRYWLRPVVRPVEPRSRADEFIDLLAG